MKLLIDDGLRQICREIVAGIEKLGPASLYESDSQYSSDYFCGGFAESGDHGGGFYFSFYAPDGGDYIFHLSLTDVYSVAAGGKIDPILEYWKKSNLGSY